MRPIGRGVHQYQKAKNQQESKPNTFQAEKRGPFGHTYDEINSKQKVSSAAKEEKPLVTPKLNLLHKKYGYSTLRNNSASAGSQSSSHSSGGSTTFKINFEDQQRLSQSQNKADYDYHQRGSYQPLNPSGQVHLNNQTSQNPLTKKQREDAIKQHNRNLDYFKAGSSHQGSASKHPQAKTQWQYDEDEENTPSQSGTSIELKPMTLQRAIGTNQSQKSEQYKESPLQNHYISAISKGEAVKSRGENVMQKQTQDKFDWDQIFGDADAKSALAKRNQNSDLQVSMSHASEFENGDHQGKKLKKKSKIGGQTTSTSGLNIPGSKPSQKAAQGGNMNNHAAKHLKNYLEKQQHIEANNEQLKCHIMAQKEEANKRKDNKVQNQLNSDMKPAIEELKQFEIQKTIQVQLLNRNKKKKDEEKNMMTYQMYQPGCNTLENQVSGFFVHEGRMAVEQESERIKQTSMHDLQKKLQFNYRDGNQSTNSEEKFHNSIDKILESNEQQKKQQQMYNQDLERCKQEMRGFTDRNEYVGQYDTIHPKQNQSNITNIQQNLLFAAMNENSYPSGGRGITGSSMGYGDNQHLGGYQLRGMTEPALQSQNKSSQSSLYLDSSSQPNLNTQIGKSQYYYTSNIMKNEQTSNSILSEMPHMNMYQKQQVYNKTPVSTMPTNATNNSSGARTTNKQTSNVNTSHQKHTGQVDTTTPSQKQQFFFESHSKYISLKKFTDDLSFKGTVFNLSLYQNSSVKSISNKELSLQKWFEKLLNHEKAIVMTIVDKELVKLIQNMYLLYAEYGHGYFTSENPHAASHSPQDAQRYQQVSNFKLYFKKPAVNLNKGYQSQFNLYTSGYDQYGPSHLMVKQPAESNLLKEQQKVQDNLIDSINIIKIGTEEAITLNNDFLENNNFLLKMLQTIDSNFLMSELKIEKIEVDKAMLTSVISKSTLEDKESKAYGGRNNHQVRQKLYFTVNERDQKLDQKTATNHMVITDDFKSRTSQYGKMGNKPHPTQTGEQQTGNQMTFGQVLSHIFEKAINIQYQEFQNKLSHQMKEFFYSNEECHIYEEDLKLAKFWKDMKPAEVDQIWDSVKKQQEKVLAVTKKTDNYKKSQSFTEIEEEKNESMDQSDDEDQPYRQKQSKHKKTEIFSKELQEAPKVWDKNMKFIQDKINMNGKMITTQQKRLTKNYVNWDEKDEEQKNIQKQTKKEPDSNDTDSDSNDIEKNYNHGYKLLRDHSPSLQKGAPGLNIPKYQRALGKGHQALDDGSTVTENSSDYHRSQKNNQQLNPIYSTKRDKKDFSEGEVKLEDGDSGKYLSNYENDEFEDTDLDDDFNLPADHQQNNKQYGQKQTNIKDQISKHQNKVFAHNGSQTHLKQKNMEEQKQKPKSQTELRSLKETLKQNEETQKETKLRTKLKEMVRKLRELGTKANYDNSLDSCYMFIRNISTNVSFSSIQRIKDGQFVDQAIMALFDKIYQLIKIEQQNNLMNEINEMDESNKKGKAKQQNDSGQPDKAKTQNNPKKNKKKNKNKAKETSEKLEQENIQVVDDVVIINNSSTLTANAEQNESATKPTEINQPADQPQKKTIRSRKNKKKKKHLVEEELTQTTEPTLIEDSKSPNAIKKIMSEEKKRPEYPVLEVENLMVQSDNSIEQNKEKLAQLKEHDQQIRYQENDLAMCAKRLLIDDFTDSHSSSISTISLNQKKQEIDKYKAERTSLLHGDVQYNKYPDTKLSNNNFDEDLDSISKELSQDPDIKMFKAQDGLRKRPDREIKESLIKLNEVRNEHEQTKQIRIENEKMHAGLDDLNDKIQSFQTKLNDENIERKPGFQMIDLLEQKKMHQQRVIGDYSERAQEILEERPESGEGETKKKKKRNKNKNKKKKVDKLMEEQEENMIQLPESIHEAGKIAQLAKKREENHKNEMENEKTRWQNLLKETLVREKNDDESSNLSKRDDAFFDDNFMQREEDVLNPDTIHLYFDDQTPKQESNAIKVDIAKCKVALISNQFQKIGDMESSYQNTSINRYNSLSEQRKEQISQFTLKSNVMNTAQKLDVKAQKKTELDALFRQSQPIAQVAVELPNNDEEIPEELPEELPVVYETVQTEQEPLLSKKAQAKADKKKELKAIAKLKIMQKKQDEADTKAQKEQKRKDLQEKAKQKLTKDSEVKVDEDHEDEDENIEQQIIANMTKDIQLPALSKLNEEEGRVSMSSLFVKQQQSKKVKFQRDISYDGSNVPKRGGSRGTSLASSNKNKNEDILNQELDGLFALEYKKPQKSLVESLNTSKKNTPENSSSKHNKDTQDLNEEILQKKLEELKLATDAEDRSKNVRSLSVPLNKQKNNASKVEEAEIKIKSHNNTKNKLGEDNLSSQNQAKLENVNIKPFQPNKKEKIKDKQKQQQQDQSYAQIQPQPSIQIIKPEPKLTSKQKKKLHQEKAKAEVNKQATDNKEKAFGTHKREKARERKSVEITMTNVAASKANKDESSQPAEETKQSAVSKKKQKKQQQKLAAAGAVSRQEQQVQLISQIIEESKGQAKNINSKVHDMSSVQPAVEQQKLQQILTEDHITLHQEEAKKNSQGQPNVNSNKNAVAQGYMDHNQILKNIETYKNFNGNGANNNQMVKQKTNNSQIQQQQQFNMMDPQNQMNWLANNQLMQQSMQQKPQMFNQIQQNTDSKSQNQSQPNQTINIDIISISYQQNMQQNMQNIQNNQNLRQQTMFNFQNKQIQSNTSPSQPITSSPQQMIMTQPTQSTQQPPAPQTQPTPQQPLIPFQQQTQPQPPNQQQYKMPQQQFSGQQQQSTPPNMFNFPQMQGTQNQFNFNQNQNQQQPSNQFTPNFGGMPFNPSSFQQQQTQSNRSSGMQNNNMNFMTALQQQMNSQNLNQMFNNIFMNNINSQNSQGSNQNQFANQNNSPAQNNTNSPAPNTNIPASNMANSSSQNMAMFAANFQKNNQMQQQSMMGMTQQNSGGSAGSPNMMQFMGNNQQQINLMNQFNMFSQMISQQNNMNSNKMNNFGVGNSSNTNQQFMQNSQFYKQLQQQQQQFMAQQSASGSSSNKQTSNSITVMPQQPGNFSLAAQQNQIGQQSRDSPSQTSMPANLMNQNNQIMPFEATQSTQQSQQIDQTQSSMQSSYSQPTQYIPVKLKDQLDSLSEHSKLFHPTNQGSSQMFGPQPPNGSPDKFTLQQQLTAPSNMLNMNADNLARSFQPNQLGLPISQRQQIPYNASSIPLLPPMMGQNMLTPQQEQIMKFQQLLLQGYIMPNCPQDQFAVRSLSSQDMSHVHEFYEVLDAQIDRIKEDQKNKLRKAQKLRDIAFNLIKTKIQEAYKQKQIFNDSKESPVKVEIYGSMATGLAIDSSDLDIIVHGFIDPNAPRSQNLNREQLIEELQMLHSALEDVNSIKENNLIQTASVPVIKLQVNLHQLRQMEKEQNSAFEIDPEHLDEETKVLHIDITLDEPQMGSNEVQHLGIQCCNYIKSKIDEHPNLKIMALLFKKFLSLKNLNKPYKGGLSSYSLIQMILAVLHIIERDNLFLNIKMSLSMIFKKFVWEYGQNFDPSSRGISQQCTFEDRSNMNYIMHSQQCNINEQFDGITFENEQECDCGFNTMNQSDQNFNISNFYQFSQPALVIVDPLNKFNNIGKSSYEFKMVQEEFRDVYMRFNEELKQFVMSCSQKQSGQPGTPYDVDNLLSRILLIDYKLAKLAPIIEHKPSPIVKKDSVSSNKQSKSQKSSPGSATSTKKQVKPEANQEEEKVSNDEIAKQQRLKQQATLPPALALAPAEPLLLSEAKTKAPEQAHPKKQAAPATQSKKQKQSGKKRK